MVQKNINPDSPYVPLQWRPYAFTSLLLHEFKNNEFIFFQGETIDRVYCIIRGRAKSLTTHPNGNALFRSFFEEGMIFGELELINGKGALNTVRAAGKLVCVSVSAAEMKACARENAELMELIATDLAGKVYIDLSDSMKIILSDLKTRLSEYIDKTASKNIFSENLMEVSGILGVSYQHLYNTMKQLCSMGILEKAGKKHTPCSYRIIDPKKLRTLYK